jgi:hypothetical protein
MWAVLLMSVLQISTTTTYPPTIHYQWVATPENGTPVALCDAQFTCHCPVGYKANTHQGTVSTESIEVTCEPTTGSQQQRETYDSYPVLPKHENFGK